MSVPKILIADDDPPNVAVLSRLMVRLGYEVVTARNGLAALEVMATARPDVILLDVEMPRLDGFAVCRKIKCDPRTRLVPVILVTGLAAVEDRVKGIEAGADAFLSKPFVIAELEAQVRSLLELKAFTDGLDSAESILMSLAQSIEARDPYTHGHCDRLARYASAFGRFIGLDASQCRTLHRGGILHDIGKIAVPDAILLKAGPLTTAERHTIERHTVMGDALCRELHSLQDVRPIIRHHHERLDGSGYPDGLAGDDVPLLAQIMSIVDAYDAITTDRPYQAARTPEHAIAALRDDAARGLRNVQLVERFATMVASGIDEPEKITSKGVA